MRSVHRLVTKPLQIKSVLCLVVVALTPWSVANAQQPSSLASEERERGIELYKQHHIPEAVEALRKAVKKNKADYEAWHFLGLALIQNKDLKNATKSFETALKVQPRFAAGQAGLAYALLLRNKPTEATRAAQAALRIDPGIADAHYILGVVRLRAGAKEDALEHAEAVIKFRPQFGPAYLLKSQALVSFLGDAILFNEDESAQSRKVRYGAAAEALEKYLQLTPTAPDRELWIEQLDSLRFSLVTHRKGDPEEVSSGKEVTAKARVLSKPEPAYTEQARLNQVTGTVILRCIFAADGTPKHFLVVRGLPDGLTQLAIRAARKIKFVPATIDGRPVSMWVQLEYNFNLY